MKCVSIASVIVGSTMFVYVSKLILMEINKYQPEPYMDEVFHIAQAQRFCVGRYNEVTVLH